MATEREKRIKRLKEIVTDCELRVSRLHMAPMQEFLKYLQLEELAEAQCQLRMAEEDLKWELRQDEPDPDIDEDQAFEPETPSELDKLPRNCRVTITGNEAERITREFVERKMKADGWDWRVDCYSGDGNFPSTDWYGTAGRIEEKGGKVLDAEVYRIELSGKDIESIVRDYIDRKMDAMGYVFESLRTEGNYPSLLCRGIRPTKGDGR